MRTIGIRLLLLIFIASLSIYLIIHGGGGGGGGGAKVASRKAKINYPTFEQEIVKMGPDTSEFVTVVSIYFPLDKNTKHTPQQYQMWIKNMAQSVEAAPLAMYTNKKGLEAFKELRKNSKYRTTFYVYEDLWAIMKELEAKRNASYKDNYQHKQYELDLEKYHVPELYAVWNLKPFYVCKIAELNPYNSEYFIYTDAGAWRYPDPVPNWPDVEFTKQVAKKTADYPFLGQVGLQFYNFPWDNLIQGTWFAGSARALAKYEEKFYEVHDERMDRNLFIGKDQTIMNTLTFGLNISGLVKKPVFAGHLETARLKLWDAYDCGDIWLLYQRFFAPSTHYKCGGDRMARIHLPDQLSLENGYAGWLKD